MRSLFKLWIKARVNVGIAMCGLCGIWFLIALNAANEDPDVPQVVLSSLAGLWWLGKISRWN